MERSSLRNHWSWISRRRWLQAADEDGYADLLVDNPHPPPAVDPQQFARRVELMDNEGGIGDVLATLCTALEIAPDTENVSDMGRPIKIADGTPIQAILT